MLTWISILTSHIAFRRACKAQLIPHSKLPYRAPFGLYGSILALCFLIIVIIFKGAEVFVHGFDYNNFIVQYIGIPVYLVCICGYKFVTKSRRVRASLVDLVTGVPTEPIEEEIARLREKRLQEDAKEGVGRNVFYKLYRNFFSWLI
jgi:amino acid transporter